MNKIIVENDTMRFYSTPVPIPVGGSQWSKIFFMFSDEWEDLRKIAQFRQGELKINVDIDSNNFCYVPNEMLPDMCGELSIVGYPQDTASAVVATANSLMLNFVQGFESGGDPAVPPTPDLYQKLIKEFAGSGGGTAYTIGHGLKLDAETNTLSVDTADKMEQDNTLHINVTAVNTETMEATFTADRTPSEMLQASANGPTWCVVSFPAGILSEEAVSVGVPPAWPTPAFGGAIAAVHGDHGNNKLVYAVQQGLSDTWILDLSAFAN